jgi:tetratricopeptide (TPR) repeat protein
MSYSPCTFDPDTLFPPLVVGVPQETATYLELADPEGTQLNRLILRAKFYELSGHADLALRVYDRILSSDSKTEVEGGAWFCKGKLLAGSDDADKRRDEILRCFQKSLECAIPSSLRSRVHAQLGMCHMYTFADQAAGLNSMKHALQEPEAPSYIKGIAAQSLAAAAQESCNYSEAVTQYGHALKEQLSQNARASILTNLGRIYHDVYVDAAAALDYWRQAVTLFSPDKIDYGAVDEECCRQSLERGNAPDWDGGTSPDSSIDKGWSR